MRVAVVLCIVMVAVLLAAGCAETRGGKNTAYGIDASPTIPSDKPSGTWKLATTFAAFGPREGFTSVAFDNRLWVIAGNNGQLMKDVWYSRDGIDWKQATPWASFPERSDHTSVVFDNKIWVIGGSLSDSSRLSDAWYSRDGINWTQATAGAGFSPRHSHSSVVFDGKIWVIGGYPEYSWWDAGNDIWYSSDGKNWTLATPHAEFSPRWGHKTVVHDNKMWVFGGSGKSGAMNDVWYSTNGINWTLATSKAEFGNLQGYGVTEFDNKIWIIAGLGNSAPSSGSSNDVWYSDDGITWIQVKPQPAFSQRIFPQIVTLENKMWLIGGLYHEPGSSGSTEDNIRKDSKTDVWFFDNTTILIPTRTDTPSKNVVSTYGPTPNTILEETDTDIGKNWTLAVGNPGFAPRIQFSSVVFQNKIWIIGGFDDNLGFRNDVWNSSDGRNWVPASTALGFLKGRMGQSAAVFKDKIWIIGGSDEKGVTGDVWCSGDGVNWIQVTHMAEFGPRTRLSSVVFNNQLWIIGGSRDQSNTQILRDAWYSDDGISWKQATPQIGFIPMFRQNLLVFDGKLWDVGNVFYRSEDNAPSEHNEIWKSDNGRDWNLVTSYGQFPARFSPGFAVYDNKMWIVGGVNSSSTIFNDVWYSTDGIRWKQATAAAGFSGSGKGYSAPVLMVFDNRMWVIRSYDENGQLKNDVWYSDAVSKSSLKN